ncbi:hypothetical protein D7X74_40570 [Corallococcus sp. CA047B]|nr:hypothetical protein D7X74_40570 [Corallococcus sp. CA047B]
MYWALGGLTGGVAGIGAGAALVNTNSTAAMVAIGTGLVACVVGTVGAYASYPSLNDSLNASARDRLLFPYREDLAAGARGVNTLNGERRRSCGGTSVPLTRQPAAAQEAKKPLPTAGQRGAPITVWPPP